MSRGCSGLAQAALGKSKQRNNTNNTMKTKTKMALFLMLAAAAASAEDRTTDKGTTKDASKTRTIWRTNYVNVPVVCAQLDVADFRFESGHVYRLYVADGTRPWRNWGTVRPGSNTLARIWFPAASTRAIAWQVVDVTPGFPQAALAKVAPDCISKPQWVILGIGNIRQAR